MGSGIDISTPEGQAALYKAAPNKAGELLKQRADIAKANADTDASKAKTAKDNFDTLVAKHDQAIKEITNLQTPQDAIASVQSHVQAGNLDAATGQSLASSIPQDPAQFAAWQLNKLRGLMTSKDQVGLQVADANTVANNDTSRANTAANNATSVATNAATNATSLKTNAATNATSRSNNQATIAKDMLINGFDKSGNPTGDMETTAKAIASGQLPPPSGMALTNPKNQRILARVMEINPSYDFTDVTAKKKAASDFTSGTLGNALRSVSTANAHLDQMNELVDALGNGNTQAINKISNWYQTQTGNAAPTNFNAIKNVVGQEVVKAIVAGGGGVGEREEAAKAFSTANSPSQLKEAIQHYRMVMGAQADNLLAQRDAAGLSRSTLPNYNGAAPKAATVPSDISALLQKHGGK